MHTEQNNTGDVKQIRDYEYLIFIICGASVWGVHFFNESSIVYIKRGAFCFLLVGIVYLACARLLTELINKPRSRWAWPFHIKMTMLRSRMVGIVCFIIAVYKFF